MKKHTLIELILGTVGGLIFSVGMCMCLITEWGLFTQGAAVSLAGFFLLLCMIPVYRRSRPAKQQKKKNIALLVIILFEVVGALIMGTGMSKIMVGRQDMIIGLIIGMAGLVICVLTYSVYAYIKGRKA